MAAGRRKSWYAVHGLLAAHSNYSTLVMRIDNSWKLEALVLLNLLNP